MEQIESARTDVDAGNPASTNFVVAPLRLDDSTGWAWGAAGKPISLPADCCAPERR
jgi:hypothetical protein